MSGDLGTPRAQGRAYLGRLEAAERRRLADVLGLEQPFRADAVLDAATEEEGGRRLLGLLSPDAKALLFHVCRLGRGLDLPRARTFARGYLGWAAAREAAAFASLVGAGLAATKGGRPPELFPPLYDSLQRPSLLWVLGLAPEQPAPLPWVRRLALLLAYAEADPPLLTQEGSVAVRWLDRASARFTPAGVRPQEIAASIQFLWAGGLLAAGETETERKTLRVHPKNLDALRMAPEDLALGYLTIPVLDERGTALPLLAALDRASATAPEGVDLGALASAGTEMAKFGNYMPMPPRREIFETQVLYYTCATLRSLGLLRLEEREDRIWVTRAAAPPAAPAAALRCVVLPTFEVLVPEDADPVGVARLGTCADLVSVDRVTRFVLTKASFSRAALVPGGVDEAIRRLAEASEHGLPDNVLQTLEGWGRRAQPMRPVRGSILLAGSDEQATYLRSRLAPAAEVAPRVFRIEDEDLPAVTRQAAKDGHLVAPVLGKTSRSGYVHGAPSELVAAARSARDRVAAWTKLGTGRARATGAAPRTPELRIAPPVPPGGDELRRRHVRSPAELGESWPFVARATERSPHLFDFALSLDEEALDCAEDARRPRDVRDFLEEMLDLERAAREQRDLDAIDVEIDEENDEENEEEIAGLHVVRGGLRGTEVSNPPGDEPAPWRTLQPGNLRTFLETHVALQEPFDVLFVGKRGARTEARIRPESLGGRGGAEYLGAKILPHGGLFILNLDRIVAVRD